MERGFGVKRGIKGKPRRVEEGSLLVGIYCMREDSIFNNYFKEKMAIVIVNFFDMTVLIQKLYSQLTGHKRHFVMEPL